MKKTYLLFLLFVTFSNNLFAQGETDNWIMGLQDMWLIITDSGPTAYSPPNNTPIQVDFFESAGFCSSVSDKDGNLLLYTNGNFIGNSELNLMLYNGGNQLGSSLITPDPNCDSKYYIFGTAFPIYGGFPVRWTNINIGCISGSGSMPYWGELGTNIVPKLSATYHANGIDIWLLSHDWGNNSFRAWLITDQGISTTPVTSNIGLIQEDTITVDPFASASLGKIRFSPGGNYVAMSSVGLNAVEVFKFDNETGILSDAAIINVNRPFNIEFSSNGTMLYIGQYYKCYYSGCNISYPDSSRVYQADLLLNSGQAIDTTKQVIFRVGPFGGTNFRLTSNLDIFINSSSHFHRINSPNLLGDSCDFEWTVFNLPNGYPGDGPIAQFPNFFVPYIDFNIVIENTCHQDTTLIFTLTNQRFDSIRWEFEDVAAGLSFSIPNQDTVYYTFSEPGSHEITLKRYKNGILEELKKMAIVKPNINIDLPEDTIMCEGSNITLIAQADYCDFAWVNHYAPYWWSFPIIDTIFSDTCIAEQAQDWWPILLNHHDYCGSMDSTYVTIQQNMLNLGNDTSGVCSLNPITLSTNTDSTLSVVEVWSTGDTTSSILAASSGLYSVTVTTSQCVFADTININYIEPVNITLPSDSVICEGETATFYAYSIYYNYAWVNNISNDTVFSNPIQISESGIYYPIATNYPNYCGSIDSINITVQYDSLFIGNDTIACLTNPLVLDATLDSTLSVVEGYIWSTGDTTASITATESGYYWVIANQGYCTFYDTINIFYDEPLIFSFADTTYVCDSIAEELTVGDIYGNFIWSPTGETTPEIMVVNSGLYSVTASNGCGEFTDTTEVISLLTPNINIGNDTLICSTDSILLDATSGTPSEVDLWSTGDTVSSIWVNLPAQYFVTVSNACGTVKDSIIIENDNPAIVSLANDTFICFGESLQIAPEIIGSGNLQWSNGETTQNIEVATDGEYVLTLTNACGDFSDTLNLWVQINDFAFSQDTAFISNANYVQINVNPTFESYLWSNGSTYASTSAYDLGTYYITVTDTMGCAVTDSIVVTYHVSISELSSLQNIKIYPNPVTSILTIKGLQGNEEIKLIDILGRELITTCQMNPIAIDFANQPAGVYFLTIKSNSEIKVFKVVKR